MSNKLFLFLIFAMLASITFLHADNSEGVVMHPKKQVVILLGPPGSGKGTQASRIVRELHMPHISTGDLFRENIKKNTPLGIQAQEFMNAGKLVPDSLVLDMLYDRIEQPDCIKGYLLDGFPRTIPQAEAFQAKTEKDSFFTVINLSVPDEEILKRLTGRMLCRSCGEIYNRHFSSSKIEGSCDSCGGELYQREDDQPQVVKQRLVVYHEQTAPLIDFYKAKGVLLDIDGTKKTELIFSDIMEAIRSHNAR